MTRYLPGTEDSADTGAAGRASDQRARQVAENHGPGGAKYQASTSCRQVGENQI